MAFGTVKWFSDSKGFGFIQKSTFKADDEEVFVHYSAIQGVTERERKTLKEGDPVQFDLYEDEKGLQALNVVRLD